MSGRGAMAMVLLLGAAPIAGAARLTVTATRAEVLYAPSSDADCSMLHKTDDAALPFYIVRLRAEVPAGQDPTQLRYQWDLPKPNAGVLVADEDLGPTGQNPVIRTMCAEVGTMCSLTEQQLAVYNEPSILWIAPTCAILPSDTAKAYRGGKTKFGVRVFQGKHRLGKGSTSIGWGHLGKATLLISIDPTSSKPSDRRFRDGIGVPGGERSVLNPVFGAQVDLPTGLPAVDSYTFASGGGGTVTQPAGCPYGLTSCTAPGQILYTGPGKNLAQLSVNFADGSLLCDNLLVNITTVPLTFTIDVTTAPSRKTFTNGDSVNLRVRVRNTSPPSEFPGILFVGPVLSCATEVKVGSTTFNQTAQIDLQHCSTTVNQPCGGNNDCQQPACMDCVSNETCLTSSHCASVPVGCVTNDDCSTSKCPDCIPGDVCVQVLPLQSVFLDRGDVFDIVNSSLIVTNTLPTAAKVKDTWTARSFNAGEESEVQKYTIKPSR